MKDDFEAKNYKITLFISKVRSRIISPRIPATGKGFDLAPEALTYII
jgi:hypothetical protein